MNYKALYIRNNNVANLRNIYIGILLFSLALQAFIEPGALNLFCAAIAAFISIWVSKYTINIERFSNSPFSMLIIFGYNFCTLGGALAVQSFSWRAITYNLELPLKTFLTITFVQIIVIGAHLAYTKIKLIQRGRRKLSSLWKIVGLFHAPTNSQLWIFGLIGSFSIWHTRTGLYGESFFGNVGFNFFAALAPFAVAPFLIPVAAFLFDNHMKRRSVNYYFLGAYFLVIVLISIGANSRFIFAFIILTLLLAYFITYLLGRLILKKMHLMLGVLFAIPIMIAILILTDIAIAMLIVRGQRIELSATELLESTIDAYRDKSRLRLEIERYQSLGVGSYNETYIENIFLARLIHVKFADLNISLASGLGSANYNVVRSNSNDKILAIFPTPIMKFFNPNLDKEDLDYSSGDLYNNLVYGDAVGGHKTGSVLADGFVVLGWIYVPALIFLLILKFIFFDSLVISRPGKTVFFSAVGILFSVNIFMYGVIEESLASQIGQLFRGFPQFVFLYTLLYHSTRIFAGKVAMTSQCSQSNAHTLRRT